MTEFEIRQTNILILRISTCPLHSNSALFAKHVQLKAAKWAASKRPKKSRPSDKNRAPIIYELHSMTKPSEYTVADAPAVLMAKPAAVVASKEE
jgi:hypothetical protein